MSARDLVFILLSASNTNFAGSQHTAPGPADIPQHKENETEIKFRRLRRHAHKAPELLRPELFSCVCKIRLSNHTVSRHVRVFDRAKWRVDGPYDSSEGWISGSSICNQNSNEYALQKVRCSWF